VSLETATVFCIADFLVRKTEKALQDAGRKGYELFVLWSGNLDGDVFTARTVHVPEQRSFKTVDGLLVRVEGPALHRLNAWLYEREEILGAQVHAHPTDAYHSATDDAFPIVTELGGLSLVAADFAVAGLLSPDAAAFRLSRDGWVRVPATLIEVVAR
jgi:hypothetical protein